MQEINAIYGQQQLENIKNTLGLIRELKILNIEYNLLNYNNYNGILKYLNISNKIYLHTNDDLHANDDLMLHINDNVYSNMYVCNMKKKKKHNLVIQEKLL